MPFSGFLISIFIMIESGIEICKYAYQIIISNNIKIVLVVDQWIIQIYT